MNTDLLAARTGLLDVLAGADDPFMGRSLLASAVPLAEYAESIGEEHDTRMLSGVLSLNLQRAVAREDGVGADYFTAKMLAVFSDLADLGDEAVAEALNRCVDSLPSHVVQLGMAYAALRRGAAND